MGLTRKTVLILEDESIIAMSMEDLIRDLGLEPLVATTIDGAQQAIATENVAFAVLDLKIRSESSEPVAVMLRQKAIPFLVCSGSDFQRTTDAFDGVLHIGKPYADRELQDGILAGIA